MRCTSTSEVVISLCLFADPSVRSAYESIWFIGDAFISHLCSQYFINSNSQAAKGSFTHEAFELKAATENKYVNKNPSVLGRIRNYVVQLLNSNYLLPKCIVQGGFHEGSLFQKLKYRYFSAISKY